MKNIKLAFVNTLWLLVPSVLLFTITTIEEDSGGSTLRAALSRSFFVFIFPNIILFLSFFWLFFFLRKNYNRFASVIVSTLLGIGSFILLGFWLGNSLPLGDFSIGGIFVIAVGILAFVFFFIRSIFIAKNFNKVVAVETP